MKNEFELEQIEKFKLLKQGSGVVLGPGDDAAILTSVDPQTEQLVFCGDMLIEGVHFDLSQADYNEIGHKAVARTLSDIAAMGATPLYMGFSLALPKDKREHIDEILVGALAILKHFDCSLVGGDMSIAEKIFCDTWCVGKIKKDQFKTRSGAIVGDAVFVSGKLGGSYESKKHLNFLPRITEANLLIEKYQVNGMIDISDGFVFDLYRILRESGLSAKIYEGNIPLNSGVVINGALYDGEDYELLFTAPQSQKDQLVSDGFFCVGEIIEGDKQVFLVDDKGDENLLGVDGFSSLS